MVYHTDIGNFVKRKIAQTTIVGCDKFWVARKKGNSL